MVLHVYGAAPPEVPAEPERVEKSAPINGHSAVPAAPGKVLSFGKRPLAFARAPQAEFVPEPPRPRGHPLDRARRLGRPVPELVPEPAAAPVEPAPVGPAVAPEPAAQSSPLSQARPRHLQRPRVFPDVVVEPAPAEPPRRILRPAFVRPVGAPAGRPASLAAGRRPLFSKRPPIGPPAPVISEEALPLEIDIAEPAEPARVAEPQVVTEPAPEPLLIAAEPQVVTEPAPKPLSIAAEPQTFVEPEPVVEAEPAAESEPVEAPPEVIEPEFELAEAAAETAVPIVPPAPAAPATAAEPQRDAARPAHAAGYRRETPPRVAAAGAAVRGLEAYEREDFVTAFDLWSGAARNGDPEAQYRLGQLYQRGQGVIANLPDAVLWYCRAAEQGHAEAQYQLSLVYQRGYGGQTGLGEWFRVAAENDKGTAERNLALLFPNGLTIERDETEALRWSLAAAQHGHAEAQANTGQMYARASAASPITRKPGIGTAAPPSRATPPGVRHRRALRQRFRGRA